MKLDPLATTLLYSTYIGPVDFIIPMALDPSGNAVIAGTTVSTSYPTTPGAFSTAGSAFVTKLNSSGSALLYSTFLSSVGVVFGIDVDPASGDAFVAGSVGSANPATQDAFITRLNSSGTAEVYSALLGGSKFDRIKAITLGPGGVAYVAGVTQSSDFPVTPGAFDTTFNGPIADAFAAKILPFDAPDLSITKTGPPTVGIGNNLVYTLSVRNAGSQDALNVSVTDPTPTGLTFVSNAGACATAFPCSLGTMTAGASTTITSTFSVPLGYSGPNPILNTATVSTTSSDPNPFNDSSTASTRTGADVSITKTGPTGITPGTNIVYTITISNAGPSDASNVTVNDATPTGLTFVSNAGACTTAFPCSLGTVTNGASAVITSTFLIPAGYSGPNPILNTASVSSTTPDPVSANNSSTASTASGADVSIAKTGPAGFTPGQNLTYTIVVSNTGPAAAANVVVADVTPSGLTFVSNSGACATAFPCSLGTLAAGQNATITATYAVPSPYTGPSPVLNTATVTSSASDPNPLNNLATVSTPNAAPIAADLSVGISGPPVIAPGTSAVYTVTVTNFGPSSAPNVTLKNTPPSGLSLTSSSGCSGFPCSLGKIDPGATVTVVLTYSVPTFFNGADPAVNTVSVMSSLGDPNLSNNSASASSRVDRTGADLGVALAGPAASAPGQNLSYTMTVFNNGPGQAFGVTLSDPTPAGLVFVSNAGDCAGAFPCSLGNLSPGQTKTVVATFTIPASYTTPNPVINQAAVFSALFDPNYGNNAASSSTTLAVAGPAQVFVSRWPAGMVARPGTVAGDSFVLTNSGSTLTTISLDQTGDFFLQTPTTFDLAPGASQTVHITSLPQMQSGAHQGTSVPSGAGYPKGQFVGIGLLVDAPAKSVPPPTAVPNPVTTSAKIAEQAAVGLAGFHNSGTEPISGILMSGNSWILPDLGSVTIGPGETRTLRFLVNHERRLGLVPANETAFGRVWLLYATGPSGDAGRVNVDVVDVVLTPAGRPPVKKTPGHCHGCTKTLSGRPSS